MRASEIILEYYDPAGDQHRVIKKSDTRRPRLTLRHLNKLRRVKELRKLKTVATIKEFVEKQVLR